MPLISSKGVKNGGNAIENTAIDSGTLRWFIECLHNNSRRNSSSRLAHGSCNIPEQKTDFSWQHCRSPKVAGDSQDTNVPLSKSESVLLGIRGQTRISSCALFASLGTLSSGIRRLGIRQPVSGPQLISLHLFWCARIRAQVICFCA